MKRIGLKNSSVKIFNFIYSLAMIFGLVVLILVSIFLYKNFYSTILILSDIVLMQEDVSSNNINIDKFNIVIENFEKEGRLKSGQINDEKIEEYIGEENLSNDIE